MDFDYTQLGMAIFLTISLVANIWFVAVGIKRLVLPSKNAEKKKSGDFENFQVALFFMAAMDVPWVFLCALQCWMNAFGYPGLDQIAGNDGAGCLLMGFYSTFSLFSMMGSNCLVAYYINQALTTDGSKSCGGLLTKSWTRVVAIFLGALLPLSILFAFIPLMTEGFALTTGGFCYADWTSPTQSSCILVVVVIFLIVGSVMWCKNASLLGNYKTFAPHASFFFVTWFLWIPAAINGILYQNEIAAPYMLIGGIAGHALALSNPLLYGVFAYKLMESHSSTKVIPSTVNIEAQSPGSETQLAVV